MTGLCSICQDFLTERPQRIPNGSELIISALRCGHLFHRVCVEQWFQSCPDRMQGNGQTVSSGCCPCCKKVQLLSEALQIFPTGDEETEAIIKQKRNLDAVTAENIRLVNELDNANDNLQILEKVSKELEDEIFAHDMLKMEYGQSLSKIQHLQEQLQENLILKSATDASYKTELDKLKKEKMDAKLALEGVESRERKLIAEMESLRISDKENLKTKFLNGARENTIENGIGIMIMKSGRDETSDGESPSISPSSSQSMQRVIPLSTSYFNELEPSQSNCE